MSRVTRVRCSTCRNIIANYVAGCWIISRGGRVWVGREVVSIRCERCGTVWWPENAEIAEGVGCKNVESRTIKAESRTIKSE